MTEEEIRALAVSSRRGADESETAAIVQLASVLLPTLDGLGTLPLGTIPPATVFLPEPKGGGPGGGEGGEA